MVCGQFFMANRNQRENQIITEYLAVLVESRIECETTHTSTDILTEKGLTPWTKANKNLVFLFSCSARKLTFSLGLEKNQRRRRRRRKKKKTKTKKKKKKKEEEKEDDEEEEEEGRRRRKKEEEKEDDEEEEEEEEEERRRKKKKKMMMMKKKKEEEEEEEEGVSGT